MENLLLPFLWFFMLLEWIYKKIRNLFNWIFYEPEPVRRQGKRTGRKAQDKKEEHPAQDDLLLQEKKPATDDGMEPQERILPYIPPPEPVKEKPIEIIFEPPKRGRSTDFER